jgi:hypothetical protein
MSPHITQKHRRAGWGLFDLLCFVAACALIYPAARWVSHYFPDNQRAVFFVIMATVYPAVGLLFCFLLHRLFRWDYNRRHRAGASAHDDSRPNDA